MKGIFQRLLGGEKGASAKGESSGHKSRPPRVRLLLADDARFDGEAGSYLLINLSESGFAIACNPSVLPDQLDGTILFAKEQVKVSAQVKWRAGDSAGACLTSDAAKLRGLLRRHFAEELKAQEMSEVAPERLTQEEPGVPHWYYAPANYELFFLEQEGKIGRFELAWNGKLLSYARGALRFGLVDPEQQRQKPEHARSELVKWQERVAPEEKRKALRILENVAGLEAGEKRQIRELIG